MENCSPNFTSPHSLAVQTTVLLCVGVCASCCCCCCCRRPVRVRCHADVCVCVCVCVCFPSFRSVLRKKRPRPTRFLLASHAWTHACIHTNTLLLGESWTTLIDEREHWKEAATGRARSTTLPPSIHLSPPLDTNTVTVNNSSIHFNVYTTHTHTESGLPLDKRVSHGSTSTTSIFVAYRQQQPGWTFRQGECWDGVHHSRERCWNIPVVVVVDIIQISSSSFAFGGFPCLGVQASSKSCRQDVSVVDIYHHHHYDVLVIVIDKPRHAEFIIVVSTPD